VATLDRRQALKLFAALSAGGAAAPLLAACSSPAPAHSGQVTIGLIVPQSGPLAKVGEDMTTGFQVYLNLKGNRLGGVPAALMLIDEGATAATGLASVKAALQAGGVSALAGVASSGVMNAIRDTVVAARVPLIGSNGVPERFVAPNYIWQTAYVAGEAGTAMGSYLASRATLNRVLIYSDGSADGNSEATSFSGAYTGMTQLILTGKPGATGPASDLMAQIANWQPDAVFAACSGQTAVGFIDAYRTANISAELYGPGLLTEGWVLNSENANARSVYTTMNYAPDIQNTVNDEFVFAYTTATKGNAAFGRLPSVAAMAAYDAALVLDNAISEISGSITAEGINAALSKTGVFESPRGQWEFNQSRTPRQRWYLRQVRPDGGVLDNVLVQSVASLP